MDTRNIYIADCLISMSGCISQLKVDKIEIYNLYMRAWNAIKKAKEFGDINFEFEEAKM
jgi:hypothetical protein